MKSEAYLGRRDIADVELEGQFGVGKAVPFPKQGLDWRRQRNEREEARQGRVEGLTSRSSHRIRQPLSTVQLEQCAIPHVSLG